MNPVESWAVVENGELQSVHPEEFGARASAELDGGEVVPVLIVPREAVRDAWACFDSDNNIGLSAIDASLMAISPTADDAHAELALECTKRTARVGIFELEGE